MAILLEVAARHPGFTPTATFFVNKSPFAEPGGRRYLGWLHEHGFEVGNHTLDHLPMHGLSADQVRRQIAADAAMITKAVPGIEVSTLALPLGSRPRNHRLMMNGQWHGTWYRNAAAFLVGSGSASSPFARSYDPTGVPRVRSQGRRGPEAHYASSQTLDRLAASPIDRYTSDGDPAVVSFPKAAGRRLRAHLQRRRPPLLTRHSRPHPSSPRCVRTTVRVPTRVTSDTTPPAAVVSEQPCGYRRGSLRTQRVG